jgi:DNA (cytosine-5)-methyltransferase 1
MIFTPSPLHPFTLSLFPGAGLLDEAFRLEGYHVVCAPDKIWGGDIRTFHAPPGKFNGVIGGSPCQDFSRKRKQYKMPPTGYGLEMLREYLRVVWEAQPDWFLLENVPGVPDVCVEGYVVQRLNLNSNECGMTQDRLRCFQFGSRQGLTLVIERGEKPDQTEKTCMATEGKRSNRRNFADFCRSMGLPGALDLPGLSIQAKYSMVGNGVPIQMGRIVARAILEAHTRTEPVKVCICNCGRKVSNNQKHGGPACRQRMKRARDEARRDAAGVVTPDKVTVVRWPPEGAVEV